MVQVARGRGTTWSRDARVADANLAIQRSFANNTNTQTRARAHTHTHELERIAKSSNVYCIHLLEYLHGTTASAGQSQQHLYDYQ